MKNGGCSLKGRRRAMSKKMFSCVVLVLALVAVSLGDAWWTGNAGDGDWSNQGNWSEDPTGNETYIDTEGPMRPTFASGTVTLRRLKGPGYHSKNVKAELSSGTVVPNEYFRMAYKDDSGNNEFIISGGTLDCSGCPADSEYGPGFSVGLGQTGTLTVTAGLVKANEFCIATPKWGESYVGQVSTVNLSGGVIEVNNFRSDNPASASFVISGEGVLVLPGDQSLDNLPAWVSFEGGEGQAEFDTPEYPGRTKFSVTAGGVCPCPADMNDDGQRDLEDLQLVAALLLEAGSPFVIQVEPGHCADINNDEQLDLEDLQLAAGILLDAGSPFVVPCE